MPAQLLERPIVIMADVAVALPGMRGDFFERVSLKKMKTQRLALRFGQFRESRWPSFSSEVRFERLIVPRPISSRKAVCLFYIRFRRTIELPAAKVSAVRYGALIGNVHEKGTDGSFRGIKSSGAAPHRQEYVLDEIVCLFFVTKDSLPHRPYQPGVPAKQQTQRLSVFAADSGDQDLIGGLPRPRYRILYICRIRTLLPAERQDWKPSGGEGT